jgi:adenosylcobinamide amidohydrolase
MQEFNLPGTPAKLVIKDNVLAVISDTELTTISSGIYNGGYRKVKAILNVSVPEGYSDSQLHNDPMNLVYDAQKNLEVSTDFVAMITAAKIANMSMVTRQKGDIAITVVATAGCRHGESSGEEIEASHAPGTINIIAILNGKPTDSCLVSLFLTATEAKTAALIDYDIRSRYTGDSATGTITDSLSVASTNQGATIELGGPASPIGQLVASAVRQAVKEAATKQDGQRLGRPLIRRLTERRMPMEKLAAELSKIHAFNLDEKAITVELERILARDSLSGAFLLAAVKLDDDYKKGLIPNDFGNVDLLSARFGNLLSDQKGSVKSETEYAMVDLPPFTKQALITILQNSLARKK